MVVNGRDIYLEHVVSFAKDETIFAAGRESSSRHLRLFIINERTGDVFYSKNACADAWEELYGSARADVVDNINSARYRGVIPCFRARCGSGIRC